MTEQTTEEQSTAYDPIKVHVVKGGYSDANPRYRSNYQTVKLTAGDPVENLLPTSDDRIIAYVCPIDDPITISNNQSDAQNGVGATLPKVSGEQWIPIQDSAPLFGAATTFSGPGSVSRVSVISVYRGD